MNRIQITTLDIERETGIKHHKVMRDVRDKWLSKFPLNTDGFSLSKIGQSDFIVESITYTNSRGKAYPAFKFNQNAANAFMANYKLEHAMKLVDYISVLEQENLRLEEENQILKDLVWENIGDMKVLNQRTALQVAGIKHPIIFMRELRKRTASYKRLQDEGKIVYQTYDQGKWTDRFTQEGFQWLLDKSETMNAWVEEIKISNKKLSKSL